MDDIINIAMGTMTGFLGSTCGMVIISFTVLLGLLSIPVFCCVTAVVMAAAGQ